VLGFQRCNRTSKYVFPLILSNSTSISCLILSTFVTSNNCLIWPFHFLGYQPQLQELTLSMCGGFLRTKIGVFGSKNKFGSGKGLKAVSEHPDIFKPPPPSLPPPTAESCVIYDWGQ
jgi:hypothetical protein